MKTEPQVYRAGIRLCIIMVFFLAFLAPAAARQKDPSGEQKKLKQEKTQPHAQKSPGSQPGKPETSPGKNTLAPANNKNPTAPPVSSEKTSGQVDTGTADLARRLEKIEDSYVQKDSLGLLPWLSTPVLGVVAILILIALSLHLVHFVRMNNINVVLDRLITSHTGLARAVKDERPPANNTATQRFAGDLDQHAKVLNQLSHHLNQMEERLSAGNGRFEETIKAITLTANWIGEAQLSAAFAADRDRLSDSERASIITMLERYREPLRLNATRVEPVAQSLSELVEAMRGRLYASPELLSRVQGLNQGIHRFDQWHAEVEEDLNSLQLGSFGQRNYLFQLGQDRLLDQVKNGSLSVAEMIEKSRQLLEQNFPKPAQRSPKTELAPADREANLKKIVTGACDYLMDWYNNLFQFQHQLEQGQRSSAEAEIASELSKIQRLAREALSKFDVQPEAIQIGQTQYDRRLHEAILVRQSQFPINTVIEIHECGFRKMSTGEALRRPQVIVAGAGVN